MTVQDHIVFSQGGYPIGNREPDRSYWAVKLNTGTWLCEMDLVDARIDKWVTAPNTHTGLRDALGLDMAKRTLDWTLDLAGTGDWKRITELWLICPPTPTSPAGNTARLPITVPGTAFQLKVGMVDSSIGQSLRRQVAQMIGRVTDVETGDCEVFVFDYGLPGLLAPWKTNVYNVGTWRPNIPGTPSVAPIGRISFDVLGLHFGERGV